MRSEMPKFENSQSLTTDPDPVSCPMNGCSTHSSTAAWLAPKQLTPHGVLEWDSLDGDDRRSGREDGANPSRSAESRVVSHCAIIQWQRAHHRPSPLRFFSRAQKRHPEGPGDCLCAVSATPSRPVANLRPWQYTILLYAIGAAVPPLPLASKK